MSVVFLDTSPLGMISNPKSTPDNDACRTWLLGLMTAGIRVIVPEIADYEVRRELIRSGKTLGLKRLDRVKGNVEYLPITTDAMLKAATLWAEVRNSGKATADIHSIDGDVILAAQALTCGVPSDQIVVATTNVGHLERLLTAKTWQEIG